MNGFWQWIQDNLLVVVLIIIIAFQAFILIRNDNWNTKNLWRRLINLLIETLDAVVEFLIDIKRTCLGVLQGCADFFEVLRYILFGNFHSHIRFAVANYTILFASVVSFYTTLNGLRRILNFELALILSFTIQTALVLASLCCAQNFSKELPKYKKIVTYDLSDSKRTRSNSKGTRYWRKAENGKRHCIIGIIFLVLVLPIIFLSSSLTYVYIYGEKLDDYVLYKTAHDVMMDIENDINSNQASIDQYFYLSKEVLIAFRKHVGNQSKGSDELYTLIEYLEKANTTEEDPQKILAEFEAYLEWLKLQDPNDIHPFLIQDVIIFPENAEGKQLQIELSEILLLAENAVNLKRYYDDRSNNDKEELKDMNDINDNLANLRTYLANHVLASVKSSSSENTRSSEQKNTENRKNMDDTYAEDQEDSDKQSIRKLVSELILKTQEFYNNQIPKLQDISVWSIEAEEGRQTNGTENKTQKLWKKPVENGFAAKYNHYLEVTDIRITLVSRAFKALCLIEGLFLRLIYGLCYSSDVIILCTCFVRSSQRPGKSVHIRRNLVYAVFIRPESKDEENVLHSLLENRALNMLKLCKSKSLNRSVEVYQHLDVAESSEDLALRESCPLLNRQEETRDELYIEIAHILTANFYQEILLLYSVGLAYPVTDSDRKIQGYVITKECIHDLLQTLFDTARRRGIDTQTFKEDLKEYEEDTWED